MFDKLDIKFLFSVLNKKKTLLLIVNIHSNNSKIAENINKKRIF